VQALMAPGDLNGYESSAAGMSDPQNLLAVAD